jgi:hypothetical protein
MSAIIKSYLLLGLTIAAAGKETEEKARYLRLPAEKPTTECVFTVQRSDKGWSISSVTERGMTRMTVTARYNASDVLSSADAMLTAGDKTMSARVTVADGQAQVKRDGQPAQEFDVPAGVIVTSAPDWSDTLLLCRRYDRHKGGKQEFTGLWIHPEQAAQRLTVSIERVGSDTIEHDGKKRELDRHTIRIRNNSGYVAWTDSKGQMIKLMSLPIKQPVGTELVLEGYEKSAANLRPAER